MFETLRKLALTGLLVILIPGTAAQVMVSIFICIASMRMYSGCRPFIEDSDDRFSEIVQWQLLFTMQGALAIKIVSRVARIARTIRDAAQFFTNSQLQI